MDVLIRPTTAADLPRCAEIMVLALNDLAVRLGRTPDQALEHVWVPVWWQHLLQSTAGFWVADQNGRLQGFGNCLRREGEWFLSHLFIDPQAQSQGIGSALFNRCWVAAADAHVRAVVADGSNLVSVSLYARQGMGPQVPLLNLSRPLAHDFWQRDVLLVELQAVKDTDHKWLAQFDRTIRGHARPQDHDYFAAAGLRLYRCMTEGVTVGYVYTAPWGHIGPAVAGPKSLTGVVAAALAQLQTESCPKAMIYVSGHATELLAWLLQQGFRHEGLSVYAADTLRGDWRCYVPYRAGLP